MIHKYEDLINLYKIESAKAFDSLDNNNISTLIEYVLQAYKNEKTIFVGGNGGSVGYIQNFVVDMNMHPFVSEDKSSNNTFRNKFKCVNLCSDQSTLTGLTNDLGYENVFVGQLGYQGEDNDIFIGISGSGNSKNILNAMALAKNKGMKTVLFTRNVTNKCSEYSDLVICLDGTSEFPGQTGGNNNNFHFEDIFSKVTHLLCGILKQEVQNA
tara:strand:+ start:946 stop:1581 length:636 start_codon:yes stop_codon:yes gene_type:complete